MAEMSQAGTICDSVRIVIPRRIERGTRGRG
jgi:hypothetical protein